MIKITSFNVLFFVFTSLSGFSQWINPNVDSLLVSEKLNEISINEENKEFYSTFHGGVYTCDLLFKNTDTTSFKVSYLFHKNQKLVFFKLKYATGQSVNGYFRKTPIQFEDNYDEVKDCWVQDLIWHYFDENNQLIKTEFYGLGGKYDSDIFK